MKGEKNVSKKGVVFNVQRFTIHDGPGLRTEFFLKGCPLHCRWCGNPESISPSMQLGIYKSKCLSIKRCGACVEVCPEKDALHIYRNKLIGIDNGKCQNCNACYEACPSDAIKKWGDRMSVSECMDIIRKDKTYYERSGGGVTVSGGDPILQVDFVKELFQACQEEGIHTCFESCLFGKWEQLEKVLPYTDLVISDIKHMNTEVHREYTGQDNQLILENLRKLSSMGQELILRIPIIPTVNDSLENMEATADFIIEEMNGNVRTLQLLSYMRLGVEKYQSIGEPYHMEGVRMNRRSFQKKIVGFSEYFNGRGIHCLVGTKEKD